MALTIVPTIQEGKVVQMSLSFDKPLSIVDFRELLEKIAQHTSSHKKNVVSKPVAIKYPVYSNGEMIAVVEKYPDGRTKRTYV